jgi:phosphoserine phosphatase RsbU/P
MKILIADDEIISRKVLEETLENLGHEVVVTEDGAQAWEAFQKEYYPILISDWLMPRVDGLTLVKKIRAMAQDRYTYIVMITVLGGKIDLIEALDAGADDFITKPFDGDLLAARLRVVERILGMRQHVSHLEGLLPICMYCKKIRDDQQQWQEIESYISKRSEAEFSHGLCPECYEKYTLPQIERLKR